MTSERRRHLLFCALLTALVLAVYAQVAGHPFVEYDDPTYVRDNPLVRRGLTLDGLRWAFTTGHMGNWNPLTWLSHMLDVQLFGLNAGAHHLVNVALHVANTLVLLATLQRMTRSPWRSLMVAALFAVHPLHVESVAWVAERKDVLSTLFWFLAIWAYSHFVEARSRRWYAVTTIFFALGLMAKPMLVTVPFTLLLLDLWPLGRLSLPWLGLQAASAVAGKSRGQRRAVDSARPATSIGPLLWEKAPLFAMTVLASLLALAMQVRSGAVATIDKVPLDLRLENALVAYVRYPLMALWPGDLAVLYPYDTGLPGWQPLAAAVGLVAVSILVVRLAGRRPYALVGWLWYLGTLLPVIGVVQIGSQALADRYTYVPLVGVFVLVAWGAGDLAARWAVPAPALGALSVAVVGAYAAVAWVQVGLWRSSVTLFEHAIRVTRANHIAHNNLGVALAGDGEAEAALAHFREALRLKPDFADAYNNVGLALWRQGQRQQAVEQYRNSLRYSPDSAETHSNLALVLAELGRTEEALAHFEAALQSDPQFAPARFNLGNTLRDHGRVEDAVAQYQAALRIRPDYAEAHVNLGVLLAQQGHRDEAAAQFRSALQYQPGSVDALLNLGLVQVANDRMDEAITTFSRAVEIDPSSAAARVALADGLRAAGRHPEAIVQYRAALRVLPESAEVLYKLGVALIENGATVEAIDHLEHALRVDPKYALAHNDLGVALVANDRADEAIGHFEEALRLDPALPDAQYNLGIATARKQNATVPEGRPAAP